VLVGVAPGVADDASQVAASVARAMRVHSARFGPFPFASLSVAVLPDVGGGIEYPGVILLGKGQTRDATASHEVAHEWFYGLVGDDQARDPWLDESFATYAEALDRGTAPKYLQTRIPAGGRGRVGQPMTFWESRQSIYFRSVYIQGAVALLRARAAAGAAAFDRAVRCYVDRNAHRIATPANLRQALEQLPEAVRVLRAAGALR
jgi:aminopeptidase N